MAGKPHLGTDRLVLILKQMRAHLLGQLGAQVSQVEGSAGGWLATCCCGAWVGGRGVARRAWTRALPRNARGRARCPLPCTRRSGLAHWWRTWWWRRGAWRASSSKVRAHHAALGHRPSVSSAVVPTRARSVRAVLTRILRGVARRAGGDVVRASAVVLAVGHSARGMYRRLVARDVSLTPKPFAVGFR